MEGCAAQTAELLAQPRGRQRLGLGWLENHGRLRFDHVAEFVVCDQRQRQAGTTVGLHRDGSLKPDLFALEGLPDAFFQRGVAGFPDAVTDMHPPEIDVALTEAQHGFRPVWFDLIDAAAFLLHLGVPGVEHHAVTRFKRRDRAERHAVGPHVNNLTEEDAALGAKVGVDEFLIVGAPKPAGIKTAREGHLHRVIVFAMEPGQQVGFALGGHARFGQHLVDRPPVDARDAGDIPGIFQPSLDLEGGDAQADEFGQHIEGGEILRAQEVAPVAELDQPAIGEQLVRHPAGLGALAAIGGASTQRLAGQALAGVGHAERTMDEDLERHSRRRLPAGRRLITAGWSGPEGALRSLDGRDFPGRVFPGQHDKIGAQLFRESDTGCAGDRHLGGAMDRKVGRKRANEAADAHVLHNGGVDTGRDDAAQVILRLGEFIREHERVESHITSHAAAMQVRHELRQVGGGEVGRPHPGVEALQAEVDRVRPILDGRLGTFPVAGRCQYFRTPQGQGRRDGFLDDGVGEGRHGSHPLRSGPPPEFRTQKPTPGSSRDLRINAAGPAGFGSRKLDPEH